MSNPELHRNIEFASGPFTTPARQSEHLPSAIIPATFFAICGNFLRGEHPAFSMLSR
jgi:hypothetical protein